MNQFYYLAKVKSQSVLSYTSFGRVDRIIEVKSIQKLQEKLLDQSRLKKQQHSMSPSKHTEEESSPKRKGDMYG